MHSHSLHKFRNDQGVWKQNADGKYEKASVVSVRVRNGDMEYVYRSDDGSKTAWTSGNLVYGNKSWIPPQYDIEGEKRQEPSAYSAHDGLVSQYQGTGYTDESMTREGTSGFVDVEDGHTGAPTSGTSPTASSGAQDRGSTSAGPQASGGGH